MQNKGPRRISICDCGSGLRYKHCHGKASVLPADEPEGYALAQEILQREHQKLRVADQGLGRGIISQLLGDGRRAVCIGDRWMVGPWVTFPDFLMDYIKKLFEADWGNAEIAKEEGERHPLILLYQRVCAIQQGARADVSEGVVVESPVTAAISLYFGLAYNLYCIEHNARTQPDWQRWLHRLKTTKDFHATCYEAYAAASFIRAGFEVDFLDEASPGKKPEFLAFLRDTGRTLAVECKRRSHELDKKNKEVGHLNKALKQNCTGHALVVFIELARPFQYDGDGSVPDVLRSAVHRIDRQAATPEGQVQQSAYVMLTNQPQVHFLECGVGNVGYLHGYKIPELSFQESGPIEDLLKAREAHPEVFRLVNSMQRHDHVPNTFDASERHRDPGPRTLLDCFDFYFDAYKDTPRAQLLAWMEEWPEQAKLRELDQPQLVRRYVCAFAPLLHERIRMDRRTAGE